MSYLSEAQKEDLYKSIIPIAIDARRTFISDDEPIKDSFSLIEQLGFLLLCFPSVNNNSDLSGFFVNKGETKCIYINTNITLGRQYTSVWHEFYHYYSKDGQGLCYASKVRRDPTEYKADAFAGCILMPEYLLRKYIEINYLNLLTISEIEIIKMQNYFRVSLSSLITRLIQVYPEYRDVMVKWYELSKNTAEKIDLLNKLTLEAECDIKLIQPTKDVYIPKQFYINLESNLRESRITKEKAYELLEFIDGLNDDHH